MSEEEEYAVQMWVEPPDYHRLYTFKSGSSFVVRPIAELMYVPGLHFLPHEKAVNSWLGLEIAKKEMPLVGFSVELAASVGGWNDFVQI